MKKGAKASEMAVTLVDTKTADVVTLLEEKIKSLKHIEETVYKTTGNLEGFPNIQQETKKENLIKAMSSVNGRAMHYDQAAKDLGLTEYPQFNVSGGTREQWLHDIKLRIAILDHKQTLDKLNEFKKTVQSFMSAAEQKEMVMGELGAFLSKM